MNLDQTTDSIVVMSIAAEPDTLNDDERRVYDECYNECRSVSRRYKANYPRCPTGNSCQFCCLREIENSRNK